MDGKRKLSEQVVVVTGASSGIGRQTALRFGAAGASVVLAARSGDALQDVADAIRGRGGKALVVVTDVSRVEQIERLATAAEERFGRIDTWVNNAAIEEFATFESHDIADIESLIRTNLLGTMYGTQAALARMRGHGEGTIINVGSVESRRALPLQSVYAATKHGVKAFTEALRMELAYEKSAIDVVLILPSSIDTPLFEHARSKIGAEPRPAPPVYDPGIVAEAIVFAAEHPRKEIVIGGGGKMLTLLDRFFPSVTDRMMTTGGVMFRAQKSRRPKRTPDNFDRPSATHRVRGGYRAFRRSLYTRLFEQHPNLRRAVAAGLAMGAAALLVRRGRV